MTINFKKSLLASVAAARFRYWLPHLPPLLTK